MSKLVRAKELIEEYEEENDLSLMERQSLRSCVLRLEQVIEEENLHAVPGK